MLQVYGFNQDKGHKFKMDGKLSAKTLKAFAKGEEIYSAAPQGGLWIVSAALAPALWPHGSDFFRLHMLLCTRAPTLPCRAEGLGCTCIPSMPS